MNCATVIGSRLVTHKGWVGIAPVYFHAVKGAHGGFDIMSTSPRNRAVAWLVDLHMRAQIDYAHRCRLCALLLRPRITGVA